MFSNLSKGTKNAPLYDQAARNVACMAEAIAQSGREVSEFESLGFFVLAPVREKRGNPNSNIEARMSSESIRSAVAQRVLGYEIANRVEAQPLREWECRFLLPLIERLVAVRRLAVLSWEECIEAIARRDSAEGAMLGAFYDRCLMYRPGTAG